MSFFSTFPLVWVSGTEKLRFCDRLHKSHYNLNYATSNQIKTLNNLINSKKKSWKNIKNNKFTYKAKFFFILNNIYKIRVSLDEPSCGYERRHSVEIKAFTCIYKLVNICIKFIK